MPGSILLLLLISASLCLTLSCALGWVVAKISLKLKNKSFITVVISLCLLWLFTISSVSEHRRSSAICVANARYLRRKNQGCGVSDLSVRHASALGDGKAMAVVTAVVLALFGLMWLLLGRSFLQDRYLLWQDGSVRMYRETRTQRKSIGAALLGKEFARFLSSPNYMLNCGLGVLLLRHWRHCAADQGARL